MAFDITIDIHFKYMHRAILSLREGGGPISAPLYKRDKETFVNSRAV